jgi:hypothetical protein
VSVRLAAASNPFDGVIVARFNTPMRIEAALTALQSWLCEPASPGALPITLTEVVLNWSYPERVLLRYTGGGFEYTLSVAGIRAEDGSPVDLAYASLPLTIARPGDLDPAIRLFDTIWGPVGIAQRSSQRRNVDQLVANRALATAVNQQLRQRLASGDGTGGRDGRPGLRRT